MNAAPEARHLEVSLESLQTAQIVNPYRRFYGYVTPRSLAESRKHTLAEKAVYGRLMMYAGKSGKAWPSIPTLANAIGLSERHVKRCIARLEADGMIRHIKDGKRDSFEFLRNDLIESSCQREVVRAEKPNKRMRVSVEQKQSSIQRMLANPTPGERAVTEALLSSSLSHLFDRQVLIGGYIADFAFINHRLVVEIDGGYHETRKAQDKWRDRAFTKMGLRTLRFTESQAVDDPESIVAAIAKEIA